LRRLPLCALFASACVQYSDPCFTPQSKVTDTRVLALAADPPEARIDPATGAGEPVSMRALIADANGETPSSSVSWQLCVPDKDRPGCPDATTVATVNGWTPQSTVQLVVPASLLADAIAKDPLHGFGGIRVRAGLRVTGAVPAGASMDLIFSSATSAAPPNRAPSIAGLKAALYPEPPAPAPFDDMHPFTMTVAMPQVIRPVLADGSLEEYDALDFSGSVVHVRERVRYSFYGTPALHVGHLDFTKRGGGGIVVYRGDDDYEADEPDPGSPDPRLGLMWVTPVARGGGPATMWIVARDSRGGVAWQRVPVQALEENPNCQGPPPRTGCSEIDFGCK
jgi:hypothetical protein